MCARSAKHGVAPGRGLALAFALATFGSGLVGGAQEAHAKRINFDSRAMVSFGFMGGIAPAPQTDLVAAPQSLSRSFSQYYAFEPFVDFGNFGLRLSAQLHQIPSATHNGSGYSESSSTSALLYGGQIVFAPYVTESRRGRGYLKLGIALATARASNQRTYTSGASYSEKATSTSQELSAGAGFEFFLIQNYSFRLEGGYRQLEFTRFELKGDGTDLTGATKSDGAVLRASGRDRGLNLSGGFVGVGLSIHL